MKELENTIISISARSFLAEVYAFVHLKYRNPDYANTENLLKTIYQYQIKGIS